MQSMSLKYEPSSEPLYSSAKQLFMNRESLGSVHLADSHCLFGVWCTEGTGALIFLAHVHLVTTLSTFGADALMGLTVSIFWVGAPRHTGCQLLAAGALRGLTLSTLDAGALMGLTLSPFSGRCTYTG